MYLQFYGSGKPSVLTAGLKLSYDLPNWQIKHKPKQIKICHFWVCSKKQILKNMMHQFSKDCPDQIGVMKYSLCSKASK